MCFICEGSTYEELFNKAHRRIRHFGFTMLGVEGSPDQPSWIYTVGLTDRYLHPELAVQGEEPNVSFALLGPLAKRVVEGEVFRPGDHVHVDGFCFHFEPVDSRVWEGDLFNQWTWYYEWLREDDLPARSALELVPGLPDGDRNHLTEIIPLVGTG